MPHSVHLVLVADAVLPVGLLAFIVGHEVVQGHACGVGGSQHGAFLLQHLLLDILGLLAGRFLFLHLADAFGGGLFGVFPDGGLIVQLRRAGVFRCLGLLVGGLCLCLLGLCLSVGHGGGCADEQGGNGDGKRASIAHGDYLLWK